MQQQVATGSMENVEAASAAGGGGGAAAEEAHQLQMAELVREKEVMRVEFDAQRAKLKELFLHKEEELKNLKQEKDLMGKQVESVTSELNDLKSQLLVAGLQQQNNMETEKRKAAEEIASLQQLIHETVEESSTSRDEVRKLKSLIKLLEGQIHDLKQHSPHHTAQESTLAPVLSAVTKKIGKKLGADFFTSQDEDHREDHELLKTLIGPLEEEIKALKDKLRATDDELQRCKQGGDAAAAAGVAAAAGAKDAAPVCDMCRNYEDELVGEQKRVAALELKLLAAEKAAERHKEDLLKEIGFRKVMEEKWNEKKEEHKQLVDALTARLACVEQDVREAGEACAQATAAMRADVARLAAERERVQSELERLQRDNDSLIGRYLLHAQELQNEFIDLPNTVDDLQEAMLRLKEDLIVAKNGQEVAEEGKNTLHNEIIMLRDQIVSDQQNAKELEISLVNEMQQMKMQKDKLETECKGYHSNLEKYKAREKDAIAKFHEKREQVESLLEVKEGLQNKIQELRLRLQSLQQELDTSETVQKDFVRLSQDLQVQLEKIRAADTQVRWQHDEDVDECPACRALFAPMAATRGTRREHCRHCGQIFCGVCLTHAVRSGPAQRESKVCDVCHTLLVKSSAPYFSTEAPHSPG